MTSLPIPSGFLRSRDVISCHVTASSGELQPCRKSNAQYTPVSRLLEILLGDIRSNHVSSSHLRLPDVISSHVTASSCELQPCGSRRIVYASFRPSTATSRCLPVKWCNFRVTFGHLRSRYVVFCHVNPSSCELQPCRTWNAQYTPVFGLLQPLPGDFHWNNVTSGHFRSPKVTWRHFLSRDCLLLRATAL